MTRNRSSSLTGLWRSCEFTSRRRSGPTNPSISGYGSDLSLAGEITRPYLTTRVFVLTWRWKAGHWEGWEAPANSNREVSFGAHGGSLGPITHGSASAVSVSV